MLREIRVAPGRTLKTTPVFDTYWRFAAKRQALFMQRAAGNPPPWTDDPLLSAYRFTNAYRAADRVSQYLIKNVVYDGPQECEEVFFRTLLFKLFNRIETWEELLSTLAPLSWRTYDFVRYTRVLDEALAKKRTIYSAAYIMPPPSFGDTRKHRNHLRLLEFMMRDGAPKRIANAKSLRSAYEILRSFPSLGPFLAYQFAIDLNYSEIVNFSEMEFVVAGPGARDGIRKCFVDTAGFDESEVIRIITERAESEFSRLGLSFQTLWGRPLQLIDCQNIFCEVDKYSRVLHPEFVGASGRTRIKQKFLPNNAPLPQWYPPKWQLQIPPRLSAKERLSPRQAALPLAAT